jgi:hypothetical protein
MRVTIPQPLTLVSTTAAGSSYPEWSSSTSYSVGDRVKVTSSVPHKEYQSSQAGTNKAPATNATYWTLIGVTNPYRCLDNVNSSASIGTSPFRMAISTAGNSYSANLIGLQGVRQVDVRVLTGTQEEYTSRFSMRQIAVSTYLEFFTLTPQFMTSFSYRLPKLLTSAQTVEVTLTGPGEVGVSNLVIGTDKRVGRAQYGVKIGIVDYSRKEADEFGNLTLVKRASSMTWSADVVVPRTLLDYTHTLLNSLRATPCVYNGNPEEAGALYSSLIIYGFYRQYTITLQDFDSVICAIDIEGLV